MPTEYACCTLPLLVKGDLWDVVDIVIWYINILGYFLVMWDLIEIHPLGMFANGVMLLYCVIILGPALLVKTNQVFWVYIVTFSKKFKPWVTSEGSMHNRIPEHTISSFSRLWLNCEGSFTIKSPRIPRVLPQGNGWLVRVVSQLNPQA